MSSSKLQRPRSDWTTVLLHWGLVAALVFSLSTGWRIAAQTNGGSLLQWIDALVLQGNVVRWHFWSASALIALVVGYLAFLWRMGLGGRIALRFASLRSADRQTRLQAINRLVFWVSFALLAGMGVTGVLLYFFPGALPSEALAAIHYYLAWGFVLYVVVHVLMQLAQGGVAQLLKIVSPRMAYGIGGLMALVGGLASAGVMYMTDGSLPAMTIAKTAELPVLDGVAEENAWRVAPMATVHTSRGFGLEGGETDVQVRALHDGENAYFLFRWADPTFSAKHIPLQKVEGGWELIHTDYYNNDENDYYEDKFAVMLARSPVAGGNAIRLGPKPLEEKPGPSNKLGLHVTSDGSLADVWHWKSVRSGSINQFDDNYFGAPLEAKPGAARYTGGYSQDPKSGGGFDQNFDKIKDSPFVKLKRLPADLAAQLQRQGEFNPDAKVSDQGVFAMPLTETVPYSAELDAAIPVGTVIPSVVFDKPFEGDRGDVTVFARWKDGWWTLEAKRKLDTGSKYDQPIVDGMFMWMSVFDHNQVRHTRHLRPLRLSLQK